MRFLKLLINALFIIFCFWISDANANSGPEINMPQHKLVDRHHVNVLSGTIFYSIDDLSIGSGDFKLTHSIQLSGRDLAGADSYYYGYKDKYVGGIKMNYHTHTVNLGKLFKVLQVIDYESSNDFTIDADGNFVSLTDKKLTLTKNGNKSLILTKPSGVRVHFFSDVAINENPTVDNLPIMSMEKIEYPNGFIISIHKDSRTLFSPIRSVNTNTGFQLKYVYEHHSRPVEPAKQSATNNSQVIADSLNFSTQFPVKIIALNNAVEVCDIDALTCSTTNSWQEVTYEWPDGMPRAMYIGESLFKVNGGDGTITEFHHRAHDISSQGDSYFTPRIVNIKNNKGLDIKYHYENIEGLACQGGATCTFVYMPGFREEAILRRTESNGVSINYENLIGGGYPARAGYPQSDRVMDFSGYKSVEKVKFTNEYIGDALMRVPFEVINWDAKYYLDRTFYNNLLKVESKLNGTVTEYEYDEFNRVKTIRGPGEKTITYPYSYDGSCHNYKYCHKPRTISNFKLLDEKSVNTVYSYHVESGNVSSISYPKNKQNKSATHYFDYTQYSARYKNSNGIIETRDDQIWLLSSESICQNSQMTDGVCEGQDKVTTTYHYGSGEGSNNLFLQGKTILSEKDNKSRTYCYKYDRFGNQIEQSLPKSGIVDCNLGREF